MPSVIHLIQIENGSTAKEVMDHLKRVIKANGKDALKWNVVATPAADQNKDSGLSTGLGFNPPAQEVDGERSLIGFRQSEKG